MTSGELRDCDRPRDGATCHPRCQKGFTDVHEIKCHLTANETRKLPDGREEMPFEWKVNGRPGKETHFKCSQCSHVFDLKLFKCHTRCATHHKRFYPLEKLKLTDSRFLITIRPLRETTFSQNFSRLLAVKSISM